MLTIDTNVLIRILVDDKKNMEQVKLARQFAKKAGQVYLPQVVQIELVWALNVAYELTKDEILPILHHLYENEAFVLQNEAEYAVAIQYYQTHSADFSDCLILAESHARSCSVITFNKKFSKMPNVKSLAAETGMNV